MRTEALRRRRGTLGAWLGALLVPLALASGGVGCHGGRPVRLGGLTDEELGRMSARVAAAYDVFAVRCSRCHTLARPLEAAIEDRAHWRAYVQRMRKHPGSGISEQDAEEILVFLGYWSQARKQAAEGPSP